MGKAQTLKQVVKRTLKRLLLYLHGLRTAEHAYLLKAIVTVLLLNPYCIALQLLTLLWLCGLKPYYLLIYVTAAIIIAFWNEDRKQRREYNL